MGACLSALVQAATRRLDRQHSPLHLPITPCAPRECTSIHVAIVDKNLEAIARIIRSDPSTALEENSAGETPLHHTCCLGYVSVINALITSGCDPLVVTCQGSALHSTLRAAQSKYINQDTCVNLINLLLQCNCPIDAVNRGDKTALFCAVENGNLPAVRLLCNREADVNLSERNLFSPLYMAVIKGDLAIVRFLLTQPRVAVNSVDSCGRTPLLASLLAITNSFRYEHLGSSSALHQFTGMAIVEALLCAGT
jgi:ankyrin repeat protein